MFGLAVVSPLVPAPLYIPYCLAVRASAGKRLERHGSVEGVPIYVLPEGGMHDAIGIGWGRAGLVLASREALADEAWKGLAAHLASHVRRGDGLRASLVILLGAVSAAMQPACTLACLLALAWVARDAERRADAAAAQAVRHDARAIEAFARYAALDGTRDRGPAWRVAMAILRTLRLASHRQPALRCADFRAAAARPG